MKQGRFRPLGPYLVHLALLFILAGGLIGKFWGIEGSLPIVQGEAAEAFQVGDTAGAAQFPGAPGPIPGALLSEQGGMPKEFRSDLTFLKDGKEVSEGHLPGERAGELRRPHLLPVLLRQPSPTGPVRLKVTLRITRKPSRPPCARLVELPGGEGKIMVSKVDGNFQGYGPAVQGVFITGRGMGGTNSSWSSKTIPR